MKNLVGRAILSFILLGSAPFVFGGGGARQGGPVPTTPEEDARAATYWAQILGAGEDVIGQVRGFPQLFLEGKETVCKLCQTLEALHRMGRAVKWQGVAEQSLSGGFGAVAGMLESPEEFAALTQFMRENPKFFAKLAQNAHLRQQVVDLVKGDPQAGGWFGFGRASAPVVEQPPAFSGETPSEEAMLQGFQSPSQPEQLRIMPPVASPAAPQRTTSPDYWAF